MQCPYFFLFLEGLVFHVLLFAKYQHVLLIFTNFKIYENTRVEPFTEFVLTKDYLDSHRITVLQGWEGTSGKHPVQPPAKAVSYSRLHRKTPRQVLNNSRKGDSPTSLGSLFQCSLTLTGTKRFTAWNFMCYCLFPLPLVLLLGTTRMNLAPFT